MLSDKELGQVRHLVKMGNQLPGDWSGFGTQWEVTERTLAFQTAFSVMALAPGAASIHAGLPRALQEGDRGLYRQAASSRRLGEMGCFPAAADYIQSEGITVKDYVASEIPDNFDVSAQDPRRLLDIYKRLDYRGVDAIVLSACVQMPSLPAIEAVERESGIPVVSAAVCTVFQMLKALNLPTQAPDAGTLLSGRY